MSTNSSCKLRLGDYTPPVDSGLDIIYQDDAILIVNKPSGLLSVPGRGEEKRDSLATRVQSRIADAMIVHRLDMCTSGIMVMARGREMHRVLNRMFQERRIDKRYRALVDGKIDPPEGTINLPLITDWPNRPLQKVDHEMGKPSITHFRLLSYTTENNSSLVELIPETGRSHQLRVHMLAIGHAILGDNLYGDATSQNKADRLQLHATELAFEHPMTHARMTFRSTPPFG
ncbi:RluA family pseudouridine synthase [Sedimenticola selenatireducens]|uniref:Pseudouridine synthase n=1 Tax=Sedimenticola selenatireducens TaxID=191960 RepID=A0A557SH97_9GAMM|nr:RluA family pseudouridine synthase [Sedimenticola selenatireducens]TVO76786.1 RluA family pseudouridine synthase [Sedimenticola selenatireducens]TVT64229.1 MAG: RluA family pseudouridine synthase [Sedimenticola selenatireducens]